MPLKEVANMLEAVGAIMVHFEKYIGTIPKIADVKNRIDKIKQELIRHVQSSFYDIGQLVDTVADANVLLDNVSGGSMRSLSEACLVADALGLDARNKLLDEFVKQQLNPYEQLFGDGKTHHSLDQVDRRWAWFKRLLKTIDSKFSTIIPQSWQIQLVLYNEFCKMTKDHILSLLKKVDDSTDVSILLKSLQTSLRFEQEMKIKFEALTTNQNDLSFSQNIDNESNENHANVKTINSFSGVFDKYLEPYVKLERNNLNELLERLEKEEDITTTSGATGVSSENDSIYGSSSNMFVFIKNSIKRCTALTNGVTFLSLTNEFKVAMLKYVESLRMRLPIPSGIQNPVYKFTTQGMEMSVCYIINTCEYCAEVVPTLGNCKKYIHHPDIIHKYIFISIFLLLYLYLYNLETIIKKTIVEELQDQVDFSTETDAFLDLSALSIKVLVSGTLDKLEPAFKSMQGLNWATMSAVGEESPYVYKWQSILQEMIPKIKQILTEVYFKNFCTKLATDILARYLDVILKQRRISEIGTQQLLLDTYNIKTLLLQLENLGLSSDNDAKSNPSSTFVKLVNSRITNIETILKLISTPEELLLERFKIMWPEGQASDLQIVMNLKDMKKFEQQKFLESLGINFTKSNNQLNQTSGISNLTSMFQSTSVSSLTQGFSYKYN